MKAQYPTLNQPALWGKSPQLGEDQFAKTSLRVPGALSGNEIIHHSKEAPINGYIKNYKKYRVEFSLFIWSDSDDSEAIEAYLDGVVKNTVKKEAILSVVAGDSFEFIEDALFKA